MTGKHSGGDNVHKQRCIVVAVDVVEQPVGPSVVVPNASSNRLVQQRGRSDARGDLVAADVEVEDGETQRLALEASVTVSTKPSVAFEHSRQMLVLIPAVECLLVPELNIECNNMDDWRKRHCVDSQMRREEVETYAGHGPTDCDVLVHGQVAGPGNDMQLLACARDSR